MGGAMPHRSSFTHPGLAPAPRPAPRLAVAPMMDWTDTHCRVLHRLMSRRTLLYTEMVTAPALVRGGARRLLRFDPSEHPVACQLGGSDPAELARAARMVEDEGYDEVNLNVGCPSDRVRSGAFGAVLMLRPALVAECVSAMRAAVRLPVTVKCRIGVDEQEPSEVLPAFVAAVRDAGAARVIVHARKAWLAGLSPKQNREVPPLDHALVHGLRAAFPDLDLWINGGIGSLGDARRHLEAGMDGVMIGRAAYHAPAEILLGADAALHGGGLGPTAEAVAEAMIPHTARHVREGGRLHAVTRHMLGLFSGRPGARLWRRHLSERACRPGAGAEVLAAALAEVTGDAVLRAS